MAGETRTTIYFQPKVYRALKIKAATSDRSLSELVNAAVTAALREDGLDLEAFETASQGAQPAVRESPRGPQA